MNYREKERTILTENIIDHYLTNNALIVLTKPFNKMWFCKKMSKNEYINFCNDVKFQPIVTLHLKDKSE